MPLGEKKKCINWVTLDSGINVAPWKNIAPGTFGKNNKHTLESGINVHPWINVAPWKIWQKE